MPGRDWMTYRKHLLVASCGVVLICLGVLLSYATGGLHPAGSTASPPGSCSPWPKCKNTTSSTTTTVPTTTTTPTTTTVPSAPTVTGLTLINADTDLAIGPLVGGQTIDLASVRNLNVRADVNSLALSVQFGYDGGVYRTESTAPFAFAGDSAGDYYVWTPTVGSHTITATPYSATGATGTAGAAYSVNFTVTDSAPVTGTVLFNGGFETGDFGQWTSGVQCANYGTPSDAEFTRGNAYVVTGMGGTGTYSARIDLPASTNKSVCELLKGAPHPLDSDDYYSLEYKFPSNWVEPGGWGATLNQLGYQYPPVWGATFSFNAHASSVEAVVQGGECVYGTGCTNTVHTDVTPVGTNLAAGVWQQYIVHMHWSTTNGVAEVWWRPQGGLWVKTVVVANGPTVQWAPNTAPIVPNLDKQGFYRGASSTALSLWLDGFCRATTFSAAESCF